MLPWCVRHIYSKADDFLHRCCGTILEAIKHLSLVVVGLDTGPSIIIYYTFSTCITRRMHLIINARRFKGFGTSEAHLMIWWWTPLWMAQWKSFGWIILTICWCKPYPTISMAKYLAIQLECLGLSVWHPTWPPDACLLITQTQWHWEVLSTCMDTYQYHTKWCFNTTIDNFALMILWSL